MTALAVSTAAACLGIAVCGYLIGRLHARANFNARRPGYTVGPFVNPPEWHFPAAPPYDHALSASIGYDDAGEFSRRTEDVMLQTTVAAMDATRTPPDGDITASERRYETWLETLKDHGQ